MCSNSFKQGHKGERERKVLFGKGYRVKKEIGGGGGFVMRFFFWFTF